MQRLELEKLVYVIVEAVLAGLQSNGLLPNQHKFINNPVHQSKLPDPASPDLVPHDKIGTDGKRNELGIVNKKLVTEQDLLGYAGQGINKLIVPQKSILTPSALDAARHYKIIIQRSDSASASSIKNTYSGQVSLIGQRCSQTEANVVKAAILESGFEVKRFNQQTVTRHGLENLLIQVANQVAAGASQFGIVLDEDAFSMCIQANRLENVRGVVCWDLSSAKMSRTKSNANMLFLNNRLLGLRVLDKITRTWLTS